MGLRLLDSEGKGQGEFIRLILAQVQVPYEDKRISAKELESVKSTLPTGSLPVLDSAGAQIGETAAIARYLANLHKLYGANAYQKAQIDQVLELVFRLTSCFHASYVTDPAIKQSPAFDNMKRLREMGLTRAPATLDHLERLLADNGTGLFAGYMLSVADLAAIHFLPFVAEHDAEFKAMYGKCAKLQAHAKELRATERIAAYLKQK